MIMTTYIDHSDQTMNQQTLGVMLIGTSMNMSPNALVIGYVHKEKRNILHRIFSRPTHIQ